jgi:hypothetical protein
MSGGEPDEPDDDRADDAGRDREPDRLGDLLPDVTLDESASGWGDDDGDADERLRREVPPHHG